VKKTTIYLDDVTDRRLSDISRRRGQSRAALIRGAVELMIAADDRPPRRPRPLGASGHVDTSQRVDEILAEGFGE
jgi:Ribbon-helix-helix protein, copG family